MGQLISIDEDLCVNYADCGPWRSYNLTTVGSTYEELVEEATISEIDQDGGELSCYGYEECSNEVASAVEQLIKAHLEDSKG